LNYRLFEKGEKTMNTPKLKISIIASMIGSLFLLGLIFLAVPRLAPAIAQAQTAAEAAQPPRILTVVGEGATTLEPDLAQVNIGVMITGNEVQVASLEAEETMNRVTEAIKAQGVEDKDIQTSGFNIYANQPQPFISAEQAGSNELTYQVSNNVTVVVRDLAKVSTILEATIEAGANNIYGVTFSLADDSEARSTARSAAMTNAQAKATEIAKLAGVELGEILSVTSRAASLKFKLSSRWSIAFSNF
jgi:uncharacterized protein YggE